MENKILHIATELFLNYGFKSVTMDDIANTIGISKKTIYKYFKKKSDLVSASMLHLFKVISEAIDGICALQKNPIEEIYDIKRVVMNHLKNEKTSPQYQLKKYYPQIFNTLKKKQFNMMQTCVTANLNRGLALGIYRLDINVDFISRLYFSSLLAIRDNDLFPLQTQSLKTIIEQFYEYHLRGICTPKGLGVFNDFINKTQTIAND